MSFVIWSTTRIASPTANFVFWKHAWSAKRVSPCTISKAASLLIEAIKIVATVKKQTNIKMVMVRLDFGSINLLCANPATWSTFLSNANLFAETVSWLMKNNAMTKTLTRLMVATDASSRAFKNVKSASKGFACKFNKVNYWNRKFYWLIV